MKVLSELLFSFLVLTLRDLIMASNIKGPNTFVLRPLKSIV